MLTPAELERWATEECDRLDAELAKMPFREASERARARQAAVGLTRKQAFDAMAFARKMRAPRTTPAPGVVQNKLFQE